MRALAKNFPLGAAPFWLLVTSLLSGALLAVTNVSRQRHPADLVLATFAPSHYEAYEHLIAQFEKKHGVEVSLQLVDWQALRGRLQNAMMAGSEVPDLVEISEGSLGFYTRGPLKDVGFVDLTDRVGREGLKEALVESRFSLWSTQKRVFALPHDVHPVMLVYRRDLVEALGIDVTSIRTWNDFVAVGESVTADLDGDGVIDRYAIDLPQGGSWGLRTLLFQRGGALIDASGAIAFNNELTADTIRWYLERTYGPRPIAFEAGWGQPLAKAMADGLVLFYIAPDWRTRIFQMDSPNLAGKLAVMPLPAWIQGERRTSVWGGSGLALTKASKNPELAWELAKFLYLNQPELGKRFLATNVISPFKDAWSRPEFQQPNEFYSGQRLGAEFAALASDTPPVYSSPYQTLAEARLDEAYGRAAEYYKAHGDEGLVGFIRRELQLAQEAVLRVANRNIMVAKAEP